MTTVVGFHHDTHQLPKGTTMNTTINPLRSTATNLGEQLRNINLHGKGYSLADWKVVCLDGHWPLQREIPKLEAQIDAVERELSAKDRCVAEAVAQNRELDRKLTLAQSANRSLDNDMRSARNAKLVAQAKVRELETQLVELKPKPVQLDWVTQDGVRAVRCTYDNRPLIHAEFRLALGDLNSWYTHDSRVYGFSLRDGWAVSSQFPTLKEVPLAWETHNGVQCVQATAANADTLRAATIGHREMQVTAYDIGGWYWVDRNGDFHASGISRPCANAIAHWNPLPRVERTVHIPTGVTTFNLKVEVG